MNILKWIVGVLGVILLTLMMIVTAQVAFSEKKPTEKQETTAETSATDSNQALKPEVNNSAIDMKALTSQLTAGVTEALKPLETRIENLEKEPQASSSPATNSVIAPVDTKYDIRMGVDQFEDSFTTKNSDGYVTVQYEEFARMFHGMSPAENHPQFGTVSYVLMKGKAGPTFCHSEVGKSDPPPIKIPSGYREWRTDNTGRWMAVK